MANSSHDLPQTERKTGSHEGRYHLAGKLAQSLARRRRENEERRAQRPLRSAIPFLSASLVTGLLAAVMVLYTPCYAITIEGVSLGYIQNPQDYAAVARQVAGQVEGILGQPVDLTADLAPAVAAKAQVLTPAGLSDQIYEIIPDVKQAYILTVDGRDLAAAPDKESLDAALAEYQTLYTGEGTLESWFVNDVRITRKYLPSEHPLLQSGDLMSLLTQTELVDATYTVQENDTAETVADAYDLSLEVLQLLNPTADLTALTPDQIMTVQVQVPILSVGTREAVSYQQIIPSPVEQRTDDTMYDDEVVTVQTGTPGQAQVEAILTAINGQVEQEEILSSQTLVEPTTTIEVVGTQERPYYVATGTFLWPTVGDISSPFGYRTIFGSTSFHTGLDICNKAGTAIIAADAGTVTFVGYKGSYGNLIIIDHGNGFETYYAHCSSVLVSPGDLVGQGTHIGGTGTTGRATGNHLHFEVRTGGEPVDPQLYLPA